MQRAALGMDALRPIVVTHPLSTLTAEQLDARAREAAPQALAIWQGTSGAGTEEPLRADGG